MSFVERYDRKIGRNPNYIILQPAIVRAAIEGSVIKKISESKNGNVYYEIQHVDNLVLMRVKHDKYIVINRWISQRSKGQVIDLVSILSNFSFYTKSIGRTRERVACYIPTKYKLDRKDMLIEKVIESYRRYGRLKDLPSYMHVHHKAETWDNREATTMYIHEDFHTESKSHIRGVYIDSMAAFVNLIQRLVYSGEYYRGVTHVE